MTPFGQQLAEFEMWIARHEPDLAPSVSAIIDNHYRRFGFSGLAGMGDAVSDLLNSDPAVTAGVQSNAASDTTNILTSLFSTAGNFLNNTTQTQQRLQQLQTAAQVQQAQAQGAAANNNTMLIVGGVFAALVAFAILAKSR